MQTINTQLNKTFKTYGIDFNFIEGRAYDYAYDCTYMQLYHRHFPLFNELIAEVDSLGINMQNNTVTHVEFSVVRPYNSTHRYLNMAVTSSKGERNFAEAIDFNALPPLFYDVLFGSYEILKDMK